jgi:hypothetical protein
VVERPRAGAREGEADDDRGVGEDVLEAAVEDPQALTGVIRARRDEHRRGDHRGGQGREQAGAEEQAARQLGGAGGEGEERTGAQAEGLHVAAGPLQAVAAEPAEQLLRPVADE